MVSINQTIIPHGNDFNGKEVYMPTSNDDIVEVEKVYENIEELLKLTKKKIIS